MIKLVFCRFLVVLGIIILLTGCATTQWQEPPKEEQGRVERDPLSYGMVTSKVKKGETTQEEIIRQFGPPNITTINAEGEEVWVYDRISNASQSQGYSEASRFESFFTLGITGVGGGRGSQKYGGDRSSTTRTLTVIVTFDKDKKVKDYSARATQF